MSRPSSALGERRASSARGFVARAGWVCVACLGLGGCGDEVRLVPAGPGYRLVFGPPTAEVAPPYVDRQEVATGDLRPSRAHRCDTFQQDPVRKVDVLWVVDSSPSMADEQEKLAFYFADFIEALTSAEPPVDFQLGVVTTDVDLLDPVRGVGPGWLRRPEGADVPFIACRAVQGTSVCNVGDGSPEAAAAAFGRLVQVGVDGSPEEKGLLAAMLALSEPLRSGWNAGFLRDDAALSIVFVSDEEDSSCGPFVEEAPCLAGPSCRCVDAPSWGSVSYFSRFFQGLKGFGNEGAVRIGAIVATTATPLDWREETGRLYVGCTNDPSKPCAVAGGPGSECAFYAPRYVAVAQASGGSAVSICADDYSAGLADLGLAASGLRSEFPLGRMPIVDTIDVVVVPPESISCNDTAPCEDTSHSCVRGRCVVRVPRGLPSGWEPVICSGGTVRNVVRLNGRSIPEPLHTIEVCYDVDVGAVSKCQ